MIEPDFIAENSLYVENTLRHAFVFDLARHFLFQTPPKKLTILNAEVDDCGVDLVLSLGSITRHIQMKTLNMKHAPNAYHIAESLFHLPGGCIIWMCYDPQSLETMFYHFFGGSGNDTMGDALDFNQGRKKKAGEWTTRIGYRGVKSKQATHQCLSISQLAEVLFGSSSGNETGTP